MKLEINSTLQIIGVIVWAICAIIAFGIYMNAMRRQKINPWKHGIGSNRREKVKLSKGELFQFSLLFGSSFSFGILVISQKAEFSDLIGVFIASTFLAYYLYKPD